MRRSLAFLLPIVLVGCPKSEPDSDASAVQKISADGELLVAPDAGVVAAAQTVDAKRPGEAPAPTMAQLKPSFRWLGESKARPKGIEISFAEPVFKKGSRDVAKTLVTVEPQTKMQNSVGIANPYSLVYLFKDLPAMSSSYRFQLRALQTRWGLIEGGDNPPTATLKTPGFYLYDSELTESRGRLFLNVHASARAELGSFNKRLKITADGIPVSGWTTRAVIRSMSIELPRVYSLAKSFAIDIEAGVDMVGSDEKASAYSQVHTRSIGKPKVSIEGMAVVASADGFGIDVVCHDESVAKRRRWFWHSGMRRSFRVGHRCLPSKDSEAMIAVDPPVDFRVAPGRGGFRLLGDFPRGTYRIKILSGMTTVDNGTLTKDFSKVLTIGPRDAHIEFVENGRYLPRNAWKKLRFKHRNVGELILTVRQVPPKNLPFWLSFGTEVANQRDSDVVIKRALRVSGEPDKMVTGSLDVASLIGDDFKGVLQVRLGAPGVDSTTRLLVSDMNLLAKRSLQTVAKDKLPAQYKYTAWATAIHSHEALPGVKMSLIAPSGRAISECITSSEGSCELEDKRSDAIDQAAGTALIAQRGDDLTYLRFKDLQLPLNQSKIGGERYRESKPYRAFTYGDRDLYRPAETAHLVTIVREANDQPPKAGLPVEFLVHDPRRRKILKKIVKTDEAGLAATSVSLSAIAATGSYSVTVNIGEKKVSGSSFRVEEFMPERMRADVKMRQEVFGSSDPLEADISAEYLFGGSAKGSPVVVDCRFAPGTPKPEGYSGFSFVPWQAEGVDKSGSISGRPKPLDADGKTTHRCQLKDAKADRPLKVTVDAAVQEAGSGRTTRAVASALVLPEDIQLGVSAAKGKLSKGKTAKFEAVVLDAKGQLKIAAKPVVFTLFRVEEEYAWGYDEEQDRWTYDHRTRLIEEGMKGFAEGLSKYSASFEVAKDAPRFMIRVQTGATRSEKEIEGTGSRYWWRRNERSADRTPSPDRPVQLLVKAPKQARVGAPFEVSFEAPYTGRALISIETDELRQSSWHAVQPGPQAIPLTVRTFQPNVYVSVLILKDPHLESQQAFVPGRAFGLASVAMDPEDKRQPITIDIPTEVRPNSELLVKLDLGKGEPGRKVTIAAIDEGILSLTRYETPDPIKSLYSKRRLEVLTYETIGWNLMLPANSLSKAKGGGMAGGAKRIQPTKPVALWSGVVEVPISGKLQHSFKIPTYRGSLKVMVVAAGPKRVGSAAKAVPVRDPLVLLASLPKQLSQGDRFFIPVSLTNMSGKAQSVDVTASAAPINMGGKAAKGGPSLRFINGAKRKLQLGDGESGIVRFEATALRAIGAAKLSVEAKAGALVSKQSLDVPFSPQAPRSRQTQRIELAAGENNLTEYLQGWLPTTERSSIWVTTNPYADTFNHLSHLIRYPYGCIEQTVSSSRPLLFAGLALSAVDPELAEKKNIPEMIKAGIDRVLSMQTPSGGFAYWPGGSSPNAHGSTYAVHFLLDAVKQGHDVPDYAIKDAVGWLGDWVNRPHRYSWHFNTKAYAHYVMARAGQGRKGQAKAMLSDIQNHADFKKSGYRRGYLLESQMLLKAALYLSGDRTFEGELKKPDLSKISSNRSNGWSFYSDLRRRAKTLAVVSDLFPRAQGGEALAQLVAGRLKRKSRWYSTQELAWALTGLGLRLGQLGDLGTVELLEGGKGLKATATGKLGPSWDLWRASERNNLVVRLKGGTGKRYAILRSDGIRTDAKWEAGDHGLRVSRQMLRQNGTPFDPATTNLELGEMVQIQLKIQNLTNLAQENLALVDRLPAGFEIEAASSIRGFTQRQSGRWAIAHRNTRDDRIELFGRLNRNQTATFNYSVRAVSAGQFRQPPVEAEAMYNPDLRSRKLGTQVTIQGPWQTDID